MYEAHVEVLNKKKKASFRELLDECTEMTLTSGWKDVKKNIKNDPRFEKFSSSDRVSGLAVAYKVQSMRSRR